MVDERILKREEKAVFALRSLYRKRGYLPFKMSKFEEFEFYMRNKDFLVSDRIITFNDTNGKLLALKPDVTLSIIKHGEDAVGCKQKVYYDENVYRVSESTGQFKEIRQTGLECIGDIDLYDIYETATLAAESLAWISEDFILEISHLGILSGVLDRICGDVAFQKEAIRFIAEKNAHDLSRLCEEWGVSGEGCHRLTAFISIYGQRQKVLEELRQICDGAEEAFGELERLSRMLDCSPFGDRIVFDFSVINDMSYYNGIVFKGFISGICEGVLAGGQYDKLMRKLERRSGAVGFALYLDLLEQLPAEKTGYDVDMLLLYPGDADPAVVAKKVEELTAGGKTVSAQKRIPEKLRAKEIISLVKEGEEC
ncbi:MAG: ATP phosphoribosyltransferase regulatory subunit [Clostridia bacterium]|nr:ATP phosphoribosyltransferase regulatory subunit [Clostridia bacterium]